MAQVTDLVYAGPGERVDRFVARALSAVTRSQAQRWVTLGNVTVNGRPVKPSHRLSAGDAVRVVQPEAESTSLEPTDMSIDIVYEDADCVVIDKPAGLVVHPAMGHRRDTLVNGLLARYPEMMSMVDPETDARIRPGIVHRLDKDTSGLLVVARHERARVALKRQFAARQVEKVYLALVYGRIAEPAAQISASIGRDPHRRQRMAVSADGREAITSYETQEYLFTLHGAREHFTLVRARLVTGRTHQIRVHLAHIGHPVVGDAVYGRRRSRVACPRQFLHAWRLGFALPGDGRQVSFESPLPDDLRQVLSHLGTVV